MALNDIFKLTIVSKMGSVTMYNTLYFRQEIAGVVGDPRAALANDLAGTWLGTGVGHLRWFVTTSVQFMEVRTQSYYPYSDNVFALPLTNAFGVDVPLPPPAICACCFGILSDRGGRRGRGRIYVSGFASNKWTDGLMTGSALGQMDQVMSSYSNRYALASGWNVSGFRAGVWSRAFGGSPPTIDPAGFSPMSGWVSRPEVRGINRRSRLHNP